MKQFMSRVKDLSQKAAEIKAAMERVPPKVAEIREAVSATAGQLQELKSQIGYSVADLRADNEKHLSEMLQEIAGSEEALLKAGFSLDGVDIELSPVQRLLVHLTKLEDVHASVLRALATANQQRRTVHAIVSALLQGQQMAATVELENLNYCGVIIGVGPIPSVRLCWRPDALPEPAATALTAVGSPAAAPAPKTATPPAASATPSAFGPGSFFEKRAEVVPTQFVAPDSPVASVVPTEEETSVPLEAFYQVPVREPEPVVGADPLARFKKMPNLTPGRK
jgi:hypothetical protein